MKEGRGDEGLGGRRGCLKVRMIGGGERKYYTCTYDERPAVKANGTVNPSAMPSTADSMYSLLKPGFSRRPDASPSGEREAGMSMMVSSEDTVAEWVSKDRWNCIGPLEFAMAIGTGREGG